MLFKHFLCSYSHRFPAFNANFIGFQCLQCLTNTFHMFVIDLCKTCVHQCKSKIPKSTFKDPIIELLFKTSSQKKMHHYLHRLGAFPMSYNSFLKCHASIYNMFSNYSEIDKANCRYLVAGCGNQNLRSTTCRTIV